MGPKGISNPAMICATTEHGWRIVSSEVKESEEVAAASLACRILGS